MSRARVTLREALQPRLKANQAPADPPMSYAEAIEYANDFFRRVEERERAALEARRDAAEAEPWEAEFDDFLEYMDAMEAYWDSE